MRLFINCMRDLMGSIWSHILAICLIIICNFSLFESILQCKVKKQVIFVWLQKDWHLDICKWVILLFNLCNGWLNFNFFLTTSSHNIFIFSLFHFKICLLIWCTLCAFHYLPFLWEMGSTFSFNSITNIISTPSFG